MRVERTVLLLAATVLATGCEPTDHQGTLEGDLLQLSAEARDGKVYLLAPATDSIVEVDAAARDFRSVEVGRGPTLMSRPPTSDLLYTLERQDSTISRLGVDGSVAQWELGAPFTTLSWSPDGTRAVAWIDPAAAATIEVEGSLNLNAYAVLQETEGGGLDITSGSLTYEPSGVTFSADSRFALMTSSARLHVLDLDADPIAERAVPFSADEAVHRTPDLVVPAPDGARALVTVEGVQDLFVLSLNPVLIENVIGLERAARDVVWSRDGSRAILADGSNRVTFLDLDSFDVDAHRVSVLPGTTLAQGCQGAVDKLFALLWSMWMVFGPTMAGLGQACCETRSLTSDFGTESSIGTMHNVLHVFAARLNLKVSDAFNSFGHVFPNAVVTVSWHNLVSAAVKRP